MKKPTKEEQNISYTLAAKYISAVESRGDLQVRGYDSADFVDVAVWEIEAAIVEAYRMGLADAKNNCKEKTKMKKFIDKVNGYEYTVEVVTAIAIDAGDASEEARQTALLVTNEVDGEKFESVVFGWTMPDSDEDFNEMCEDAVAWDEDHETLATVRR